eukprot:411921_1
MRETHYIYVVSLCLIIIKFNDQCHVASASSTLPPTTITTMPSLEPTIEPTSNTHNPSIEPTVEPARQPTLEPTKQSVEPSFSPTIEPTTRSRQPTIEPAVEPPLGPTIEPSLEPTIEPTKRSKQPTLEPTIEPTKLSKQSTLDPTVEPSLEPTIEPTLEPTIEPTKHSRQPTLEPIIEPSLEPTIEPTKRSKQPTLVPISEPSLEPTIEPTLEPTNEPTNDKSSEPTTQPILEPTVEPTTEPTMHPTSQPTLEPTSEPKNHSSKPSIDPTITPSKTPTTIPTIEPTNQPTFDPTYNPSFGPSLSPTKPPTLAPTPTQYCPTLYVRCLNITNEFDTNLFDGTYTFTPSKTLFGRPVWEIPQRASDQNIHYAGSNWVINGFGNELLSCASNAYYPPVNDSNVHWLHSAHLASFNVLIQCIHSFATTSSPTKTPSSVPTMAPTHVPTFNPSSSPSHYPSSNPTTFPADSLYTNTPSLQPTLHCPFLHVTCLNITHEFDTNAFDGIYSFSDSKMMFQRPVWGIPQASSDRNIHYTGSNWVINGIGTDLLSVHANAYYPPINDRNISWSHSSHVGSFRVLLKCTQSPTSETVSPSFSPSFVPSTTRAQSPTFAPTPYCPTLYVRCLNITNGFDTNTFDGMYSFARSKALFGRPVWEIPQRASDQNIHYAGSSWVINGLGNGLLSCASNAYYPPIDDYNVYCLHSSHLGPFNVLIQCIQSFAPSIDPTQPPTLPPTPYCPTLSVQCSNVTNEFDGIYTFALSKTLFGRPVWEMPQRPHDQNIHYTGSNWIINGLGNALLSYSSDAYYPPIDEHNEYWTLHLCLVNSLY